MKKALLVFALLSVVLGFMGYSVSYSEASLTSSLGLNVVHTERGLIALHTSGFTAVELPKAALALASPTNAQGVADKAAISEEKPSGQDVIATGTDAVLDPNAVLRPINVLISGILYITNNTDSPFTISALRLNVGAPYTDVVPAGQSKEVNIQFPAVLGGDAIAEWTLEGELLGSFAHGNVRIGIDMPITIQEIILQPVTPAKAEPANSAATEAEPAKP